MLYTAIQAYWAGEKKWFEGKVVSFNPNRAYPFHVRYVDDDEVNCKFEVCISRI